MLTQFKKAKVSINDTLEAPISTGDELGKLEIVLDDETLLSVPLISVDEIQQGNIITRLLDWLVLFFSQTYFLKDNPCVHRANHLLNSL